MVTTVDWSVVRLDPPLNVRVAVDLAAAFESAIDEAIAADRPGDLAAARQVYADWLEEQNTEADSRLAHAQRWMAERRRWPLLLRRGDWEWCVANGRLALAADLPPRWLPREFAGRLHLSGLSTGGPWYFYYPARRIAELALAETLAALPVDAPA